LNRINYRLKFADVEKEMNRILLAYPEIYTSKNTAVRQAVINLSDGKVGYAQIDYYKQEYDNFAWFVSFAPVDNPKIAVAVLVFQGGWGSYTAPVAKEVIAKYFELEKKYIDYGITTKITN
jgi:penicillin-binding protein 2